MLSHIMWEVHAHVRNTFGRAFFSNMSDFCTYGDFVPFRYIMPFPVCAVWWYGGLGVSWMSLAGRNILPDLMFSLFSCASGDYCCAGR